MLLIDLRSVFKTQASNELEIAAEGIDTKLLSHHERLKVERSIRKAKQQRCIYLYRIGVSNPPPDASMSQQIDLYSTYKEL